jgi:hypothetical protein
MKKIISLLLFVASISNANIVIVNDDDPNEGLNDTTPVAPVAGNLGTTLGEQRLNVLNKAAEIINSSLDIQQTVHVSATFDPLTCTSNSAVLGQASPSASFLDYDSQSIIPYALQNQLQGYDDNGNGSEIITQFNSSIDNNNSCLNNKNWYYGFDNEPGSDESFLSTALHEIIHGMGFTSYLGRQAFAPYEWNDGTEGFTPYSKQLSNAITGKTLNEMTRGQRLLTLNSETDLVWSGELVNSKAYNYSEGTTNGKVQFYAPSPFEAGSSTSHFSTSLSPDEIMEPFSSNAALELGLALEVLLDIGWEPNPNNLPNYAPILDAIGALALDEDSSLTVALSGSDLNGDTLEYSLANVDSNIGAAINGTSLTLTPISNFHGEGTITVQVSDGESVDNEIVTVTVNPVNDAPTLSAIGNQVLPEDTSKTITLNATDIDTTSLTYSINNASVEIGASINGSELTFTPAANFYGNGDITIHVSDGEFSDSETITVTVINVSDAPVLNAIGALTLNEDTSLQVTLSASDADNDELTFALETTNTELNAVINGNILTITPDANYSGIGEILVSVSDRFSSDSETLSVTVLGQNDAPIIENIVNQTTDEDTALVLSIVAADVDDDALTYSATSSTTDINVAVTDNQLTLTPANNFSGAANISVSVNDGTTTATDTFVFTVNGVNDAPVLEIPSSVTSNEDTTLRFTLTASDIDNSLLTYSAESDSSELQITVVGPQLIVRPNVDHTGTYTIAVTVSDGELSDSANLEFIITPINDAPEISVIGSQTFDIASGLNVNLNASDVDGDDITFTATSDDESLMTATVTGSTLILTATDTFNGSALITVTAADAELTDTTTFTATITGGDDLVPLGVSVNGNAISNGDTLVITHLENLDLAAAGGDFTYDFSVNYNGSSRSDLLLGTGSERSLTVPASGAFAGSYFFTLDDTHSNTESFQFTVQRPALLTTSVSPILANTRLAQLTIEGAPVGSDISLSESDIAFVDDNDNTITTVSSLEGTEEGSFTSALAFIDALDEGTFSINTSLLGASPSQLDVTVVSLRELALNIVDNNGEVVEGSSVTINDERIAAWGINANYDGNSDSFINSNYELQLPSTALELRIDATGFNSQVIESDALETERSVVLELADGFYQLNGSVTASDFEFGSESPNITLNLSNGNTTEPDSSEISASGVVTYRWLTDLSVASPTSVTFTHSAADDLTITLDSSLGSESIDAELIKTVVEEAPDSGDSGTDTGTDDGSGSSGGGNAAWLLITAIALLRRKRLKAKRA